MRPRHAPLPPYRLLTVRRGGACLGWEAPSKAGSLGRGRYNERRATWVPGRHGRTTSVGVCRFWPTGHSVVWVGDYVILRTRPGRSPARLGGSRALAMSPLVTVRRR